jgi:hypothetical protein
MRHNVLAFRPSIRVRQQQSSSNSLHQRQQTTMLFAFVVLTGLTANQLDGSCSCELRTGAPHPVTCPQLTHSEDDSLCAHESTAAANIHEPGLPMAPIHQPLYTNQSSE